MGFLDGVKVIDFTHAYSGPFCSLILSDFGAEVIKIERIDGGDQARSWGPFKNDYSGYYASFSRNKRSVAIDLKSEEGIAIIYDLLKDADIMCSNFKAGQCEKFGIGYEDVKKINPNIIYASISGFGTKGELAKGAAYDNVIQAISGIMDLNGDPASVPTKIGPAIGDSYSGLLMLLGIMIAYYNRQKTGKGQKIDVTMLGALLGLIEYPVLEYANNGVEYTRMGNTSMYYAPCDTFRTKDDFVTYTVRTDEQFAVFCEKVGIENRPEYATNELRLANNKQLKAEIEAALADKTSVEAEALLAGTGIPAAAVSTIVEGLEDPQLLARDMVIEVQDPMLGAVKLVGNPIHMSENKPITNVPSPMLGEHTNQVLSEMGYTDSRIQQLREQGIVG